MGREHLPLNQVAPSPIPGHSQGQSSAAEAQLPRYELWDFGVRKVLLPHLTVGSRWEFPPKPATSWAQFLPAASAVDLQRCRGTGTQHHLLALTGAGAAALQLPALLSRREHNLEGLMRVRSARRKARECPAALVSLSLSRRWLLPPGIPTPKTFPRV